MKKKIVVAAIVALMGVGGYLGHRSHTLTNAGESDLLLANAEALSDGSEIELPDVTILCDRGPSGRCFNYNPKHIFDPSTEKPCYDTGFQTDYCSAI